MIISGIKGCTMYMYIHVEIFVMYFNMYVMYKIIHVPDNTSHMHCTMYMYMHIHVYICVHMYMGTMSTIGPP